MNQKNDIEALKELFLQKNEKLFLKIEQLAQEVSNLKHKMDKTNKINRSFGLKTLSNSEMLSFTKDVFGIGSPTKRYLLSIRVISELWKNRKNDYLLVIRQQEKETQKDLKALGIRIPIDNIKELSTLSKEVLSLLYVACQLKNIEINDILREMLIEINENGNSMVNEIRKKMI
ncbi:MAG: hypothetical protein BAJALOKI1v1_700001 [Promethearchaeota archaeon]|nr:MAG: hypothetical protein BAJALOKI1v1_700001 [Candidatus Lokiarchaeota archaeon]